MILDAASTFREVKWQIFENQKCTLISMQVGDNFCAALDPQRKAHWIVSALANCKGHKANKKQADRWLVVRV